VRFAEDRKKNRATAYTNLQSGLAVHVGDLVPHYMTAKEHTEIIGKLEEFTTGDQQSATGDPRDLISGWLIRGDRELSRIPLEKDN
jgi:hypothetical protein